jgi:hypothetical protein
MAQKNNSTKSIKSLSASKSTLGVTSKSTGANKHVGVAVLGGLAAAAAIGGYFLYNNAEARAQAKKKIKSVKGWIVKAKGEVLEKIEKIKDVNEGVYHNVVDAVMSRYGKLSSIDTSEVAKLTKELKTHWKSIQKDLKQSGKIIGTTVKKVNETKKAATK